MLDCPLHQQEFLHHQQYFLVMMLMIFQKQIR